MAAFESMFSAFNQLPYMKPMLHGNVSDTSIARKLIQARMLGLSSLDISRKFEQPWSAEMTMMPEEDWIARRDIYRKVSKYLSEKGGHEKWFPLLYNWEIHPCDTNSNFEYGHLVFVNGKLDKFLLVNAYGPDPWDPCGKGHCHVSYVDLIKTQANLVFCLAKYLNNPEPAWVRATYISDKCKTVPEIFLSDREKSPSAATSLYPPIIHITSANYVPCLSSLQIRCIDNLLRASSSPLPSIPHASVTLRNGDVETGLGFRLYGMSVQERGFQKQEYAKECAGCRQSINMDKLRRCASCGMQQYCSRECQKKQWPHHKAFCKSTQPVPTA